ncbi:MAG: CC_3452 family protein [Allosphingosinicella sp.]
MIRQLTSTLFAFLVTSTLFAATAFAAPSGQYRAEPAAAPTAARLIVKDIVWHCGAAGCVAPRGNSRPAIDCSALAHEIGTLRSFTVEGQALDSAALEKCNARAR